MNELFLKDNPDAAWVLASKLKNSLGNIEQWAKSDWNQYITLLQKGAKGDLIPALTSKSYIVAKAFENSPHGNTADAIKYYEQAWNAQRDGDAAVALGMIFADEYSDFYDLEKAISYLNRGIELGSCPAMTKLAHIFISGQSSDDFENERAAFLLCQRASKLGDDEATFLLACCYESAYGTRLNRPKAIRLMISLGENYNTYTQLFLGREYISGRFLKQNIKNGIKLLRSAADNNSEEAILELSEIYQEGILVKRNAKMTFQILDNAVENEDCGAEIFLALGRCYLWGIGTVTDFCQAKYWLRSAYDDEWAPEETRDKALVLLEDWLGFEIEDNENC